MMFMPGAYRGISVEDVSRTSVNGNFVCEEVAYCLGGGSFDPRELQRFNDVWVSGRRMPAALRLRCPGRP